jgi:conjugative transfer signal peptidase TraF
MTMTGARSPAMRWQRVGALVLLAAGAGSVLLAAPAGVLGEFRVNTTPSEPLGLWRIVPIDRSPDVGDMVFVCLSRSAIVEQARARGYLRRGLCESGYAPLIKTVVAIAGQRVEIGRSVWIDGVKIPHSELALLDGAGRRLIPARDGQVAPGHLFLHSPFLGSWDSRYFGSVPVSSVLGLAREVLTFAP